MKKIKFIWSGTLIEGDIISQIKGGVMGLKTVIKPTNNAVSEFTLYGKCEVGNCGPFTVLSITN